MQTHVRAARNFLSPAISSFPISTVIELTEGGEGMYFEILAASGGGYFARIRGGNNEIMFVSEVYTTKASARHACEVVKANAATASIYE